MSKLIGGWDHLVTRGGLPVDASREGTDGPGKVRRGENSLGEGGAYGGGAARMDGVEKTSAPARAWARGREGRSRKDDEFEAIAQGFGSRPMLDCLPLVGTEKPEQLDSGVGFPKVQGRFPRVGWWWLVEFPVGDLDPVETRGGEAEHFQPLGIARSGAPVGFVRALAGGQKDNPVEVGGLPRLGGHGHVTIVHGVEGAAKEGKAGGGCHGGRRGLTAICHKIDDLPSALAMWTMERQLGSVQSSPFHARQPVCETRFVAIDFESAGAAPGQTDHVVQIGLAGCIGLDFSSLQTYRTYVKPEAEVAWTASRVHGIDAAMVESSPQLRSLWPVVRERLVERVLVAHGAATEKRHLRAFPLHGFGPWVDTLVLARKVWPIAPSHRLGELVGGLGKAEELRKFCPGLHWHDALFDAVGALVLLKAIIDRAGLWEHPTSDLVQARLAVPRQPR